MVLWTSPIESKFSWKYFIESNDLVDFFDFNKESFFKLKLKNDIKIFIIDSFEDLKNVPLVDNSVIDFEKLSEKYDAVWLTEKGEASTKFTSGINLHTWDCESVLILNPDCFIEI